MPAGKRKDPAQCDGSEAAELPSSTGEEKKAKKQKTSKAAASDQVNAGQSASEAAANANRKIPVQQSESKKSKKEKKKVNLQQTDEHPVSKDPGLQEEPDAHEGPDQQLNHANGLENGLDATHEPAVQGKKKKKKKQKKAAASGPGNAEEAVAMRGVLGFTQATDKASEKASFGFNFSAAAPSADEPVEELATTDEPQAASPPETDAAAQEPPKEEITDAKLRKVMGLEPLHVPRRIFVGGMPFHYEEEQVRDYWSFCGEIEELDLLRFPDTGRFKGIAFITFADEAGWKEALKYNGEYIDEHQLRVDKCVPDAKKTKQTSSKLQAVQSRNEPAPKTQGYNVVYVGNIAFEADQKQLKEIFEGCRVSVVRLHTDKATGKSKGYAHVHFEDEESLDRAVSFNGTELFGRRLKIGYAQPKKEQ